MLVVTKEQMIDIEKSASEYDITLPRLMENAGSAAAAFIRRVFPVDALNCVVFCGNGNNGGDGFVVARRLSENGAKVVVVLVDGSPKSEQSVQMFDALKTFEIPVLSVEENRALIESYALHADLLIDAVYGIGFDGKRLPTSGIIACQIMNDAPAAIVSLDLPSGITCDRGHVAFGCVKADFTVVFQILKPAHILPASLDFCGDIQIVEIGIPNELYENVQSYFGFIDDKKVWTTLPPRNPDSHKGNFGRLLAVCGSYKYRGAAVLAASAAFRVGAGVCTVAAPEVVCSSVTNAVPEAIVQPLPVDSKGLINPVAAIELLGEQIKTADVVLFGCGSGLEAPTLKILEFLIQNLRVPLILDADALTLLAQNMHLLRSAKSSIVVTPHPGEMATLADTTTGLVQRNRITTALDFATKYGLTVVLKGNGTIIAQKDGRLKINKTGGHGLAKSGSGDLLAGMIAGFIAQGMTILDACSIGVWLHGTAGDRCTKRLSARYMLPHDMLFDLAELFLENQPDTAVGSVE